MAEGAAEGGKHITFFGKFRQSFFQRIFRALPAKYALLMIADKIKSSLPLLFLSTVCEGLWNVCLKRSRGLSDWGVNALGVLFLVIGILAFKKALQFTSLSVASLIWSSVSLLFTIALDMSLFGTKIDLRTAVFMGLSLLSTMGLAYFANK